MHKLLRKMWRRAERNGMDYMTFTKRIRRMMDFSLDAILKENTADSARNDYHEETALLSSYTRNADTTTIKANDTQR